jgi:stage II sporulation protein M
MMGRDLDQIRFGWILIQFRDRFTGKWENGRYPNPIRWYKQTFAIIPKLGHGLSILLVALVAALVMGWILANIYTLPPEILAEFTTDKIAANLDELEFMLGALPGLIFGQNIRVLILAALLGTFTFGVLAILIFMLPWIIVGFAAGQVYFAGESPALFILGTIVPHAIIELPAILLSMAAALRWHLTVIAPPPNTTLGEAFIAASADFGRVFVGLVIPMLFLAAYVEAYITPQVLFAIYGG